jgi:hypothetical protein
MPTSGDLIAGLMQLPVMTTAEGTVNSSLTFIPSAVRSGSEG